VRSSTGVSNWQVSDVQTDSGRLEPELIGRWKNTKLPRSQTEKSFLQESSRFSRILAVPNKSRNFYNNDHLIFFYDWCLLFFSIRRKNMSEESFVYTKSWIKEGGLGGGRNGNRVTTDGAP